jgi:hypothetical protein
MASRLSYLLWATMPDAELFVNAATGQLSTPDEVRAEATRMLDDPRARLGLRNFYEQWMQLPDGVLAKDGPYEGLYPSQVADATRSSFDAQMDDALWTPQGAIGALVTSRTAFVNASVAPLFGVSQVSGDTLAPVTLPTNERAGILGHPALMAALSTDTSTSPVRRGAFVLGQILCQPVSPQPAGVAPFTPVTSLQSVRQQLEGLTSPAGCQACHASLDPLGLLFEGLDAIGRPRTQDDLGNPVDTAVTLVGTGDPSLDQPTPDLATFGDRLGADDGLLQRCLASQLYRFAAKREIGPSDEAALVDLVTALATSGESVKSLLLTLSQTDTILLRANQP